MNPFYGDMKLGILGGGQLGRMLLQEAANFNISSHVLDPDVDAPCKNLCEKFTCGSLSDFDTVYQFGKNVDLITIEIEKVNVDALELLEKEGKNVFPQPALIRIIQDKGLQKEFFKKENIPTSAFRLVDDIRKESNLTYPFIQKLRRDGYDGRGVCKIASAEDLTSAFTASSIIEDFVDFEKEISVIVARNISGASTTFPAVEMEFHPTANLVEFLVSPAAISKEIERKASEIALHIANSLGIAGVLAVEMFLTKDGQLLVNELAPRPHNSGHQTIEGNLVSQFEQHLRCIFDMPLGSTDMIYPSVMINLLGEAGFEGHASYEGLEDALKMDGVYIHLYGKKKTKPFRKMGHVTIIHPEREEAIKKARKIKELIKIKSA